MRPSSLGLLLQSGLGRFQLAIGGLGLLHQIEQFLFVTCLGLPEAVDLVLGSLEFLVVANATNTHPALHDALFLLGEKSFELPSTHGSKTRHFTLAADNACLFLEGGIQLGRRLLKGLDLQSSLAAALVDGLKRCENIDCGIVQIDLGCLRCERT
jgi:hypothetical protein